MEKQEINLADFVNKDWFADADRSSFWLRIYTMIPVPSQDLAQKFSNPVFDLTIENIPIKIAYVAMHSGLKLPKIEQTFPYGNLEDGTMQIYLNVNEFELPPSCYVFFICPFKIDGLNGNENSVTSVLNQAESLLSSVIGNNLLRSIVYEGENALTEKGQTSIIGPVTAVPQKCDGPFVAEDKWREVGELASTIEDLPDQEKQNRLRLSLQFFQRGKTVFKAEEKFFFYWTAISIVTSDARTLAINEKLQSIYGEGKNFVENSLYWKWAVDKRNDLFKRGVRLNFHMQIERYFQMLFLDLIRHEIGLKSKQHILSYVTEIPDFRK